MIPQAHRVETLRQYLLGDVPADVPPDFFERLVSDDDTLADDLSNLEDTLFEERLRGALPPADLEAIRDRFQWTQRRRRKLGIAVGLSGLNREQVAGLWQVTDEPQVADPTPIVTRLSRWWADRVLSGAGRLVTVNVWATAAVIALVAIAATPVWQAMTNRPPSLTVAHAWLLAAPVVRGGSALGEQEVRTGEADMVQLRLDIGIAEFSSYRAELRTFDVDDKTVWMSDHLGAAVVDGRMAVTLDVSSDLLTPGSYYVLLEGIPPEGPPTVAGRFAFRARRE